MSKENYKILIVDDQKPILSILRSILSESHFYVTSALSGYEALELCNRIQFDLICMDINMPKMDGITTLEKIREKNPTVPVIIISSEATRDNLKKAVAKGANHFLTKPFKAEKIIRIVNSCLTHSETLSEQGVVITKNNDHLATSSELFPDWVEKAKFPQLIEYEKKTAELTALLPLLYSNDKPLIYAVEKALNWFDLETEHHMTFYNDNIIQAQTPDQTHQYIFFVSSLQNQLTENDNALWTKVKKMREENKDTERRLVIIVNSFNNLPPEQRDHSNYCSKQLDRMLIEQSLLLTTSLRLYYWVQCILDDKIKTKAILRWLTENNGCIK